MMHFLFLLACTPSTTSTPPQTSAATPAATAPPAAAASSRSIDMTQFKNDVNSGKVPVVIDVRTPKEYAGGHVLGAINIPLDQVPDRIGELASWKGGEIYLICESGGRSARAATLLSAQGYQTVNIEGGTYAWRNAGYPVEPTGE